MKVFLGGTCNDSKWREYIIGKINIDHFNPVVEDWTLECMTEEIKQRKECDFLLYVITPLMTGVYSIAECIDDTNKNPEKTIFCFIAGDGTKYFLPGQQKSLLAVADMVVRNGSKFFDSLEKVAAFLNEKGAAHGKT